MKNVANFFNSFVRDTELCLMGMLDIEGMLVRCNRGLEMLLEAAESELAGQPVDRFFALAPQAELLKWGLSLWLREKEHHTIECEGRSAAGNPFTARIFLSALHDTEGVQRGFGVIIENLTPAKRLETAIRASEERFKKAFSAAPDGMVISRLSDGVVLEANESWQRIFGYTREEIIGKSPRKMDMMDPAEREKVLRQLAEEGSLKDMEIHVRAKDGSEKSLVVSSRKIELDGEECLLANLRDVTENRRAQQEIRNREKLYRTLASHYPNAIIVLFDAGYNVLVAEGAGLALFGLTRETIEGANLRDVTPPGYFAGVEQYYRAAIEGRAVFHEAEVLDKHWAVDHIPVTDDGGAVWAGLMVCRDVTEMKNAILSLEKSERSNRSLLEALPDSIFHFDLEGKCLDFKPGHGAQHDAWTCEKSVGRLLPDLFPRESAALLQVNHFKALQSGQVQVCEFSVVSEKEARELEARTVPFGKDQILVLIRDITGSRNLERLAANISAREQRKLGGELHDGICQELTGISFLCKSLQAKLESKSPELGKPMGEISTLLGDAIAHTRALITGLYPAGLEHGLADAMRELVGKLGKVYPTAVSFVGEDQNLGQDVAAHLYLIAQEAAGNAARHGHAGSIRIYLGAQGENLILKVTDDGKGIPADRKGAEGRGMDIMRYRARLIGARLDVVSREGKGTTVTCKLPSSLAYGFKPSTK